MILAALLMLVVVFAEQICPYDPNAQIFSVLEPPVRRIPQVQTALAGICCPEFWLAYRPVYSLR